MLWSRLIINAKQNPLLVLQTREDTLQEMHLSNILQCIYLQRHMASLHMFLKIRKFDEFQVATGNDISKRK